MGRSDRIQFRVGGATLVATHKCSTSVDNLHSSHKHFCCSHALIGFLGTRRWSQFRMYFSKYINKKIGRSARLVAKRILRLAVHL